MKTFIAIAIAALAVWGIYALVHKGSQANNNSQATQSTQSDSTTGTSDTSMQDNSNNQQTAVLATSTNATLGTFLTSSSGMTLYKYTKDAPGVSNCTGDCAVKWPPYTISSAADVVAATGLPGNVGTITRADGTLQVTYNNAPLYYWYQDSKPGDTNGQNVGGVWFVVSP